MNRDGVPPGNAGLSEIPKGPSTSRRRFLGYLLAAPTLVVAARLGEEAIFAPAHATLPQAAPGGIPSPPEPSDIVDLTDILTDATIPTANLISVQVNPDGTASFALPRAEVGQGITTAVAMVIADEMDLPLNMVNVTLADARPELLFNQFTGGSNSMHSIYTPVRTAAAIARSRLMDTAAAKWGVPVSSLSVSDGVITSAGGHSATYGSLAQASAVTQTTEVSVVLKSPSEFKIIGTSQNRIDALAAVTGRKPFAMDLEVPGALPTMVRRPPTLNGTVVAVNNTPAVLAMPGITHVVPISTGVAVRGLTFGQCIDACDALDVAWGPGSVDGQSDATVLQELHNAELPMAVPPLNLLAKTIDAEFTYYFASNAPLEPINAIADVRPGSAEIWASLKSPIWCQEEIARNLGLAVDQVTVHVTQGGGSFGRHLFCDAAFEAAEVSSKIGVPVKLSWSRTDEFRHGRTHPMCTSRVRATYTAGEVLTFEQRHTSVATDYTQGLGEIITHYATTLPGGNFLGFAQTVFMTTANVPYNFGVTTQALNEIFNYNTFPTGSMRNVYSPDVCTSIELVVDQLAAAMGKDRYEFRREFLKDDRSRAVLDKVAEAGNWGRTMAPGTAQGIAFHKEYKGVSAALFEIDCTPATVNRQIVNPVTGPLSAVGGPRVTKAVFAVDPGLAINPRGLEAMVIGGINDGIALALTSSLHLLDGMFLEASWDNYFYTRQWNTPPDVQVFVMPTSESPGGAGEFAVSASKAATACAYAAATHTMPTSFPINHGTLGFTPVPLSYIEESPTNGLTQAY